MNSVIKLPADLKSLAAPGQVNRELRAGEARLDWAAVREAPSFALAVLLKGLDLSDDADSLGLETVPDDLEDAVLAVLDAEEPGSKISNVPPIWPNASLKAATLWEAEREELAEDGTEAYAEIADEPDGNAGGRSPFGEPETTPERILAPPSATEIRDELERTVIADLLGPAGGGRGGGR